ncbi:MAG: tetratricopeptide repeat protein [Myxococcales bacterium]|nr:tetratricopeptide repeat protein [Myxococcales bacterium]
MMQIRTDLLIAVVALALLEACAGTQPVPDQPAVPATQPPVAEVSDPFSEPVTAQTGDAEDPFAPADAGPAPEPAGDSEDERRQAIIDSVEAARSGDLDQARVNFQQLVDDPSYGGYALYNLGVIAAAQNQEEQAADYFEEALRAQPDLGDALAALVRPLLRTGQVGQARSRVQQQLSASSNAAPIEAVELLVMVAEERWNDVIEGGRRVLLRQPENLDAHYAMAMAYIGQGRVELGRYILNQGLVRDPNRSDLAFGLAQIELAAGNSQIAQSLLQQLVRVNPLHVEAWNNLGILYLRARNFAGAVTALETATRHAAEYREAWMNLGSARKGVGDADGAISAFERAIALDDRYAEPWFNLGVMMLDTEIDGMTRLQRMETALRYFGEFRNRAGAIAPDHVVNEYIAEANGIIEIETGLNEEPAEEGGGDGFGDDGFGDEGGDDGFGDDGFGDEGGGDGFGDDGFGDEGGSDGFGDDGFGDEGDTGSDDGGSEDEESEEDDWGDDGGTEDFGDEAPEEEPAEDGGSDDWDDEW